jgi:predicted permease
MEPLFRLPVRRSPDADVEEEFAFHLDMRTRELIDQGWSPAAARREARRQFGNLEEARAYCRQRDYRRGQRHMRKELLGELRQDLSFAVRALRRAPAFTIVAVLTLALGIGANTAIFSVVRGILLRPLPFEDPEKLVIVPAVLKGRHQPSVSPANAYDWRDQNRSFTSLAVVDDRSAVLTGSGDPEQLRGADVSADLFGILGVKPLRGRSVFTPEEADWPGAKSVIISETLWRTRFGSDSSLIGQSLTLDNERYQVVGVVPAASAYPSGAMLWFPFTFDPAQLARSRGAWYLRVIARLKPGVTLEQANHDMAVIGRRLEQAYPDNNTGLGVAVVPLREWITGSLTTPLFVLLGGVGFVLLIACANVANLLLVRGVARSGELAVRAAMGAGRGRLMRQLVTESLVLSAVGAAGGLALAAIGTRLLVKAAPASIPRLDAVQVDGLVLGFTLLVAALTGVLFGILPARLVVRPDLARTLREGGRSGMQRAGGNRARAALVVAEVALSVMLLAGAGLLIRSFTRLMDVDPGFRTEGSVSFAVSLPDAKYAEPERQAVFVSTLLERLRAIPGVQSAGAGLGMPLTSFSFNFSFNVAGRPPAGPGEGASSEVRIATPDYFPAMGIPIVRGRGFTADDRAGGQRVLLLTETAAQRFFPREDPLGKHVTFGWGRKGQRLAGEIVGVVGDVKQSSLANATLPQFWAVFDQWPVSWPTIVLHSTRDLDAIVADARLVVRELDPDLALSQVKTLDTIVAESVAQPRFYMVLLVAFAAVALVLSGIGIYGVIAYLVGQRSREIGIRIALGASRGRVMRMVVREGTLMTAAGIGLGLMGALALTRLMGALLFGVAATDPATYAAVTVLLAAVALAACCLPALRAARVDPAQTMRAE